MDLNFAPLRQKILSIVRIQAFDYNDDGEQLGDKKNEYVYYVVEYSGRDQWKQKINSGDIVEGRYQIIQQEQEVSWKLENGTPQEVIKAIDGEPVIKYTIPFSKSAVDTILKKHDNLDRKDDIVYTIKFTNNANVAGGGDRCQYDYDSFVSSNWEHAQYLANRVGGVSGTKNLSKTDMSKVQISCNCPKCSK